MLNSTLWFERTAREIFITSLLMAEPYETTEPLPQIEIGTLNLTGWHVPPGWYGFIPAASVGIIHRAQLEFTDDTRAALASLGEPDTSSRSKDFDGRRLVRVDGGFIVLNFIKYRDKDSTTADRSRRWRDRQKLKMLGNSQHAVSDTPTRVIRHQAEAEAEAEAEVIKKDPDTGVLIKTQQAQKILSSADADFEQFMAAYPSSRRVRGKTGKSAFAKAMQGKNGNHFAEILKGLEQHKRSEQWQTPKLIPLSTTWLNQERWGNKLPEPNILGTGKTANNLNVTRRFIERHSK